MKINSIKTKEINHKRKISIGKLTVLVFIIIISLSIPELIQHKDATLTQKLLYISWSLVIASFFTLPFIILHYGSKAGKKKVIKESLSKIDFKNNKTYYRDILKKYTPAELSYIDDFENNYPKDIIATILNLQLKNKIIIKNNYIEIANNDTSNLQQSEIYILNNIKDGKVKLFNSHDITKYVKEEALQNNLIIKNKSKSKKIKIKTSIGLTTKFVLIFWIFIILICICNQYVVDFQNNVITPNIDIIVPIFIAIIIICIILRYIFIYYFTFKNSYVHHKNNSYKRTEIGEELNEKIEGLKNYLKDFGTLSEKEQEELILWEEYLIYSVIFGINQKIIENLSPLIETVYEEGKISY